MRTIFLGAALAALAALGCGRDQQPAEKAPTCEELTDHVHEIARARYPGHGAMVMGDRKADIARCEERNVSAKERRCIMAAKDMEGLAKCRRPAVKAQDEAPPPAQP